MYTLLRGGGEGFLIAENGLAGIKDHKLKRQGIIELCSVGVHFHETPQLAIS